PGEAAAYLWWSSMAKWYYPPDFPWTRAAFFRAFSPTVGVQLAYSALFLLVATLCLRPLRLGLWGRRGRGSASTPRRGPALGPDPLLWKERHAAGRLSRKTILLLLLLCAGLLVP